MVQFAACQTGEWRGVPCENQSRAAGRLAPLFCSKDYMSFKRPCPLARYNRTSYFYPTFSESSEHSHLLVSPVLVASAVIGVVIILSCITIIVGSIRRDRQARLQRHRHRHRHHHHHHHRRRRHRHREYEHGYGELPPTQGLCAPCTTVIATRRQRGVGGSALSGAGRPGKASQWSWGDQEDLRGARHNSCSQWYERPHISQKGTSEGS
uniref:Uncharacterized protein n=1 Tax=Oryctolagus cuniculus TaxID=9986 RepID=A0A5F9C9M3_RABIT